MTARRPMLDDLELDHAQRVDEAAEHARPRHGVPGLEGDFLQHTGRRARRVTVEGVASGHAAAHRLAALRERFRRREPVPFVSDVVTATEVGDVLIEDLAIRELAGRPASFAYALTLRQFLEPPAAEQTEPPEIEPPTLPDDPIDEDLGTLIVDVVVIGPEDFDRGQITVTARGTEAGGAPFSRTLARQGDAATPADRAPWTDAEMPAGDYSVEAIAQIGGEARADGAEVTVRPGQTAPVTLTLAVGGAGSPVARAFIVHFHFDRGFIEPCLRPVMRQVAEHAAAHPRDKLLIVGHTDRSGSEAYNQSLSERRARSAYAYLTAGRDPAARAAALAEWQLLRQRRPGGELPSARDSWGLREDQFMLQDLGFYPGRIDGRDGPLTEDAVRAFRCRKGLPPGTARDDAFGAALIEDYLDQDALALAEERLFPNARAAGPGSPCDGGRTRWLGCGELSPLPEPTPTRASAWRPYRRVEFLFVRAEELPSPVLRPETLDLQPPSGEAPPGPPQTWCLDPQGQGERCAFATRDPGRAGSPGPWLVRPAEEGTLSVAGTITNEDGTPFARERFVLIAPDGRILRGEGPQGQRITGRTDAAGSFRFDDLVPGFYSLEVHRGVLARLAEHPDSEVRGSSVCKALRAASDRLDVVVTAAPVLREIRIPAVAHLMTALHPSTREVRTCADPGDPSRRLPQRTRHDEAAVRGFFAEANDIWRQARVRFELTHVVEEAYSSKTECEVDPGEFARLLAECAWPGAVNVFFLGDIGGQTEAGYYVRARVPDARGFVDGCAVSDRFLFTLFTPPLQVELDRDQSVQVLAHELGHWLGLDHAEPADRLMAPAGFDGSNRRIDLEEEGAIARGSCNAALECRTLELEVEGAARHGGSPEHLVILGEAGPVRVRAAVPPALLDPALGALTLEGGEPGATPEERTVGTGAPGATPITAVYTPAAGGPTCQPLATEDDPTPAPVPRRQLARVVIRVVRFELRVTGAAAPAGAPVLVVRPDPAAVLTAIATVAPAPYCVPRDLVTWEGGGDPLPDPLRRSVSRQRIAAFDIRATLATATRAIQIRVAQTVISPETDPRGSSIEQVRIQGLVDAALGSVHRGVVLAPQRDSLFRVRADIPGVPVATATLTARVRSLDARRGLIEELEIELRRSPSTSHHFLSPPLLAIPRAIPRAEIRMRTSPDPGLAVVRAAAGGRLDVRVDGDVPLGDSGRVEVSVRGRVLSLFGVAFDGSGADVARMRRDMDRAARVWAQAGLEVRRGPLQDGFVDRGLLRLDHADDTGRALTLEQQRLVGRRAPSPPASAVAGDLNVYYVAEIVEIGGPGSTTAVGGIAFPNDPAIALDAALSDDLALAHEIGHQVIHRWGGDEHSDQTGTTWPASNVMHPSLAGGSDLHRDQVVHILNREARGGDPYVTFDPP